MKAKSKQKNILFKIWIMLERWPPFMRIWFSFFWKPKPNSIQGVIDSYSKWHKGLKFIQVGANDGYSNDPIFKFIIRDKWEGLILEPQKEVFFQKLKPKLGSRAKLQLLNVAISTKDESRELYKISFSGSRWATGLASFLKQNLINRIKDGYVSEQALKEGVFPPETVEEMINTETVVCRSFRSLLDEYQMSEIDVLQIDTEGFDFEVIKMFPLNTLKPKIISFEIEHLTAEDKNTCFEYLKSRGYGVLCEKGNAVAYI